MSHLRSFGEIEWKFSVDAEFDSLRVVAEDSKGFVLQPVGSVRLSAIYYDTEDLRLARWGITLRRRTGGDDAGWHLKLPLRRRERVELRLPLDDAPVGVVPAALLDLVAPYVRRAMVVEVTRIDTVRGRTRILHKTGRPLAELADDVVEAHRDGQEVTRFRELELEAIDADAEKAMRRVAKVLRRAGAEPVDVPKLVRALGKPAASPPDVAQRPWPEPDDRAGDAVRAHLARHVRKLLRADVDVRRGQPDAVHQVRVCARQLRAGLKAFAPLVDEAWATALRDELRWLADAMGLARETQVLQVRLERHAAELPESHARIARAVVDAALQPQLARALDDARAALRSERHLDLLDALVAAAAAPPLTKRAKRPCDRVLPELTDDAWRRLAKRAKRLDRSSDTHSWHRTRLAAKSARYVAELALPIMGRSMRPLAEGAAEVTDLLGEEHDAAIAQDALAVLAAAPGVDGAGGYALGLLAQAAHEDQQRLRARFLERWPRIERAARD